MKKTFLVILVVLFNLNNFVFAEDLNGIWEAKFGDSKEQVISVMEARGWNVEKNEDNYLSF